MKKTLFIILSLITFITQAQSYSDLRAYMTIGQKSESKSKELIEKSQKAYAKTKDNRYKGFEAAGHFFMAKHLVNPFTKWNKFNQGKEMLTKAIEKDSTDLELRLIRYHTQKNTPKILGYYKEIKKDKAFLLNNYNKSKDKDLRDHIKKTLKL